LRNLSPELWPVRLDAEFAAAEALLSIDERERAKRFRFPHHRQRFAVARAVLRIFLGRHLGLAPASVDIRYGLNGKPYVEGELRFNLSHSGELAVYALSNIELGVDVEQLRPVPDFKELAARYLHDDDCPNEHTFLRLWTRREAAVKMTGEGIGADIVLRAVIQEFVPAPGYVGALATESQIAPLLRGCQLASDLLA